MFSSLWVWYPDSAGMAGCLPFFVQMVFPMSVKSGGECGPHADSQHTYFQPSGFPACWIWCQAILEATYSFFLSLRRLFFWSSLLSHKICRFTVALSTVIESMKMLRCKQTKYRKIKKNFFLKKKFDAHLWFFPVAGTWNLYIEEA